MSSRPDYDLQRVTDTSAYASAHQSILLVQFDAPEYCAGQNPGCSSAKLDHFSGIDIKPSMHVSQVMVIGQQPPDRLYRESASGRISVSSQTGIRRLDPPRSRRKLSSHADGHEQNVLAHSGLQVLRVSLHLGQTICRVSEAGVNRAAVNFHVAEQLKDARRVDRLPIHRPGSP